MTSKPGMALNRAVRRLSVCLSLCLCGVASAQDTPHPILFVTQVPLAADFANVVSTFGSHHGRIDRAPRGGALMIRYPDGSLRNLTQEAGFGQSGMQLEDAIAVRDPVVHWSGERAIFSMVVGAPTQQFQQAAFYWQLHEVTGLAAGDTAVIQPVANQPQDYNNAQPAYLSDGTIVFASDRPRSGERHLYPQHDEYESDPTVTGLWRLDPASGALSLLQHSPSGSFHPLVDSFGRILFTRWDHLQADQQAEVDSNAEAAGQASIFGTFDFASEAADAVSGPRAAEIFPEPQFLESLPANINPHRFNFFFPWQLNQDGTGEETLNHIGRHELHSFFARSFTDDPALQDFNGVGSFNPNRIENTFYLAEDPQQAGRYYAIDAPEFGVHGSGQLVRFDAPPPANPDFISIEFLTPRSTHAVPQTPEDEEASDSTGRYRDPLPLSDGRVLAVHTPHKGEDEELGTRAFPNPKYQFRLKLLAPGDEGFLEPSSMLTPGIQASLQWWDPDVLVTWSGTLWEMSPVEVRARDLPPHSGFAIDPPEAAAFDTAGVSLATFRQWLSARGLGVIVVRDATARDQADRQQPFNLRVPDGIQTGSGNGAIHDIAYMQFLQADQIRGIGGSASPSPGRRPLAQPLNDAAAMAANAGLLQGPPGSLPIFSDGSVALFVPSRRALAWQSLSPEGEAVVRERFWISLQPGEIRACDGCHGVNSLNQAGAPPVERSADALVDLLLRWRAGDNSLFSDGFEGQQL